MTDRLFRLGMWMFLGSLISGTAWLILFIFSEGVKWGIVYSAVIKNPNWAVLIITPIVLSVFLLFLGIVLMYGIGPVKETNET